MIFTFNTNNLKLAKNLMDELRAYLTPSAKG